MQIDLSTLSRLFSPGDKKRVKLTPRKLESISSSFDETLLSRLGGLNPAAVSFAWLSSAVDVLTFAHSAAKSLLPEIELDYGDGLASWYLDNNLKVLDLCNCVFSEIERLSLQRLKLRIATELLHSNPNPSEEKIRQAKNLLADSEGEGGDGYVNSTSNIEELIGDLAASIRTWAPQGKVSPVERLVHRLVRAAVFMTMSVVGIMSTAFHDSPGSVGCIAMPEEFPWRDSFLRIESAVIADLGRNQETDGKTRVLKELEIVETRARNLLEALDEEVTASGGSGEPAGRLSEMVTQLEEATAVMGEGVGRLKEAMNGLFQTVMGIRMEMTNKLRAGLWKPSPERPLKVSFAIENNKVKVMSEI